MNVINIAVIESSDGQIAHKLHAHLVRCKVSFPFTIVDKINLHTVANDIALCIVASDEVINQQHVLLSKEIHCKILLAPGTASADALSQIHAKWVVGYGLSGKDTITLSSLHTHRAVLAIQREFVTLQETVVEQQEIPINIPAKHHADDIMALYGALLILDVIFA